MIGKVRTKWCKINFVFRHRWEKGGFTNYEAHQMKSNYNFGVWLKTYEAVGKAKGPIKAVFSKKNHVRGYMIGIDLIVCKAWMDISGPTLEIPINEKLG
jgi:hypothetical protein